MGVDEERPLFCCGSQDLNEFFHEDSRVADRELVAVTYAVGLRIGPIQDSISLSDAPSSSRVLKTD